MFLEFENQLELEGGLFHKGRTVRQTERVSLVGCTHVKFGMKVMEYCSPKASIKLTVSVADYIGEKTVKFK